MDTALRASVIANSAASLQRAPPSLSVTGGRGSSYLQYEARRREVLSEYTLTGKLRVSAFFLQDESEEGGGFGEESQPLAKARQNLEQLEAQARGGSVELTQGEYERRIAKLQRDLTRAWNGNQRVTSLKIAIQCSKLLGEPRVPAFYPSMFVLVTDILDTFGRLVFERLKGSAEEELGRMGGGSGGLPPDFASGDVGAEVKEMCRNWIYKTACIRELLPRLYVEMALLECYRFLDVTADFTKHILRLSQSIRGIGDPLVAVHARWYLARQAAHLVHDGAQLRETLFSTVTDFLYTFHEITSETGERLKLLEASGMTLPLYLRLLSPAVGWLMAQVGVGAPKEVFLSLLATYRECCGNAMVLRHIIDGFDGSFWSGQLTGMLQLVKEAKPGDAPLSLLAALGGSSGGPSPNAPTATDGGSQGALHQAVVASGLADLYRAMSSAMVSCPPPPETRLPYLNDAWKAITRMKDPVTFTRHAAAFIELLLAAFTEREVLLLMGDLVKRLVASAGGGEGGAATAPPATLPHLSLLLTAVVDAEVRKAGEAQGARGGGVRFTGVITSESFSRLLDLFHSDAKPLLCHKLLSSLLKVPGLISDAVAVNVMCEMARAVHDNLDAFSSAEDTSSSSTLLCTLIEKVDFGKDVERTLDALSNFRQVFTNVDEVKAVLVERTLSLAGLVLTSRGGGAHPATAAFLRTVFSSTSLTIPAIDDPLTRLRLYTAAATSALSSAALSQADTFFRAAVGEIPELPANRAFAKATNSATLTSLGSSAIPPSLAAAQDDLLLVGKVSGLASAIVSMPGHPELGGCYLVRGLSAALGKYPWSPSPPASPARSRATMALLPILQAWLEDPCTLPPIPGVDSNDVLFAGDVQFKEEVLGLHVGVWESVLAQTRESMSNGHKGIALDTLVELLDPPLVKRVLSLDRKGCGPLLSGALSCLTELAPTHPLIQTLSTLLSHK